MSKRRMGKWPNWQNDATGKPVRTVKMVKRKKAAGIVEMVRVANMVKSVHMEKLLITQRKYGKMVKERFGKLVITASVNWGG